MVMRPCTSHGDVWRVSGLDASLQSLQWKRMATGFANPLGLRIVQDQVHVLSLHEISRLHDVDRDGWADYYECFHQGLEVSASHHRFATDLQTDERETSTTSNARRREEPLMEAVWCV